MTGLMTCFCVTAALLAAGIGGTAEPLTVGFEQTRVVKEKTGLQKSLRRCGWTFSEPLRLPVGWRPNPGVTRNGEYRLIADRAKAHAGECFIYLRGHLMMKPEAGGVMDVAAGDQLALRFHARDPAKKNVAAMLYTYQRDERDKDHFIVTIPFFTARTEGDWTECAGAMAIPETAGGRRIHAVIVVLSSATGAYFDDVSLRHTKTARYRNFQDAVHAGRSAAKLKDYTDARRAFDEALELAATDSERVDARSRVAQTFRDEKRYVEEAETLGRILELTHLSAEKAVAVRRRRADALMAARKFGQARAVLETAQEALSQTDESRVDIMFKIATCFEKEKKLDEAVRVLVGVRRSPQADCRTKIAAQFRIAAAWISAREYEKAREQLLTVLAMPAVSAEDRFRVWQETGDTHSREGQRGKAREAYGKALAVEVLNPYSQASVLIRIGGTFMEEKRYADAREAYAALIDMDTPAWQSQVYSYWKIGESHRAEKAYVKEREAYGAAAKIARSVRGRYAMSQINSVLAKALRLTADSCWAEGRTDEARSAYLEWLEFGLVPVRERERKQVEGRVGVNQAAAHIREGHRLLARRKYADARAEFAKALEASDGTARQQTVAHTGLGEILVAEKAYRKARLAFERALRVDGIRPDAKADTQARIGDCFAMEKNYRQARAAYREALDTPGVTIGRRLVAQERIAVLCRAEGDFEKARQMYERILATDGVAPERAARIEQRLRNVYR